MYRYIRILVSIQNCKVHPADFFHFCALELGNYRLIVVMLYCVAYIPATKSSGDRAIHGGLLNVLEKAHADQSLLVALLQLTRPGCSCSEAQACLVTSLLDD